MPDKDHKPLTLLQAALPIFFLLILIVWGLILRPLLQGQPAFPLEVIFILAAIFAIGQQFWLGYGWEEIQASIIKKLSKALPAFFILFSIGLIVSSWIVSGTIPMLVYYGLTIINPTFLYLLAFVVPIVFSTLTGTSWGSAGTIGVVLIGISTAMSADLGITAGAIIGGAYFGDKMSPLSDTTNMAALATDVDLFDHIHSMMFTTIPSAVLAATAFTCLGFIFPPAIATTDLSSIEPFLEAIVEIFRFNILLLLPPVIVLIGSLRRKSTVPTLMVSMLASCALALIFQRFNIGDVMQSLYRGFHVDMAPWAGEIPDQAALLLNRGGLYSMADAIFIAFIVFVFVGAMDHLGAIPFVVARTFRFAKHKSTTILAALAASGFTNSLTSNQFATSFIVGDAFKSRFDSMGIQRKVLSRSIEDYGTMLESIIPWHPTAVFMMATLGVSVADYWHWQLLTLINLVVAPTLAITGIGCFYSKEKKARDDT
ncbi:MAG: Na+/H+ antiporter NhaC [bacterium]|nr:Na+/H+ antiporter NhaC [bacterium]